MADALSILTIFASGVFALLVALVTGHLANRKEDRSHERARKVRRHEETQQLYAEALANFEGAIRYTERLEDYGELTQDLALVNARLMLNAPKQIIEQSEVASHLLYQWSTECRQGAPKRLGSAAIISSTDPPHLQKAKEIYPTLNDAIVELANRMKTHLRQMEE